MLPREGVRIGALRSRRSRDMFWLKCAPAIALNEMGVTSDEGMEGG